jgi:hypothetical protein
VMPWRPPLPGLFFSCQLIHLPYHPSENPSRKRPTGPPPSTSRLLSAVAHMVDTHSCRPGFRPSHIVLFTGRSAQSGARCGPLSYQSRWRANGGRAGARISISFLRRLFGVCTLPMPQPFPTNLRQFPGHRHPGDFCAGSLPHSVVKVSQRRVVAGRLHGRLDQYPTQPRRALPGDRALVAMAAGLMNAGGQPGIRADLFCRAKPLDFAQFRHDQQRRE